MSDSFSFNGTRKNYIKLVLRGRNLRVLPPIENHLVKAPRIPGALFMGTSINVRQMEIPVWIEKSPTVSFSRIKEDMAAWLFTEEPAPLRFDNDPDRIYFAKLDGIGIDEFEIINENIATTTIYMICPDPYKYSDERTIELNPNGINNIDILGNIEVYPTFKLHVEKKLNSFSIVSQDDYLTIGTEKFVEQKTYEPETLVFFDDCNSLMGWVPADYVDNGYVQGDIESSGHYFTPRLFGEAKEPLMWQGPSRKKSIGKALKNFRLEVTVQLFNLPDIRTGMIEIYLLGADGNVVGKIGIEDRFEATSNILAKAQLGPVGRRHVLYSGHADRPEYWNNFTGVLRLQRDYDYWLAYFSTVDENGVHTYPRGTGGSVSYYDTKGEFSDEITQIQIAFRKYPHTEHADMRVHDIHIWELNPEPDAPTPSIPIIAMPGDTLEFIHQKNVIRKNGEIMMGLKDFGSNFFPLKPGRNRIAFHPAGAGDISVSYRERYL